MGALLTRRRVLRSAVPAWPVRVLLLIAVAVAPWSGCARPETPIEPVFRLADDMEPAPATGTPHYCDIDDEFRRAIGCLPYVPLVDVETLPRPAGGVLVVPVDLPSDLAKGVLIAEPKVRGPHEEWQRTPTMVVWPGDDPHAQLVLPLPDQVKGDKIDVQIHARPVPPNVQTHRSAPFQIGRGARLSVSLGLDPLGGKVGASPVDFRIVAETPDGDRELLARTLEPRGLKSWENHEIDLAALTGQRVRFRLDSAVVPRPGMDATRAFGFPLWGALEVLEPRPPDGRRNMILISLDTMRGDQLEGSLDGTPLMPRMASRVPDGTVFEKAFAAYPSTTASHMTMFTGLYPATHGMIFATGVLSSQITTMPEIFSRNGYTTVAETEDAMLSAHVGFVRGFDFYHEQKGKTIFDATGDIEQTFGRGLRWVEKHPGERFFLFLHTYQVHAPYDPPPAYDIFKTWAKDGHEVPIDRSTPRAERERHLYAGEVRYTDAVLDRLLTRLGELGVLDNTIVVVTGDHGDEFGEHGQIGHGKTAYDEVLHVPLLFLGRGVVPAGKRIDVPVSLVDLAPTLLDLAGLPVPSGLHGTSLAPLLRDEPFDAARVLYAEAPPWGKGTGHRVAVRAAGFSWIVSDLPDVPMQIYDLTTDPGEHHELDDARLAAPGEVLQSLYRGLGDSAQGIAAQKSGELGPMPTPKPELDERTVEKLRQLGYMD